jgi:hypothetical protein
MAAWQCAMLLFLFPFSPRRTLMTITDDKASSEVEGWM